MWSPFKIHSSALLLQCSAWLLQCCFSSWTLPIHNSGYTRTNRNRILISSYVFPATPRRVGDDIQKGIGQVALVIERIVPPTERDVTEIPTEQREQSRNSLLRWKSPERISIKDSEDTSKRKSRTEHFTNILIRSDCETVVKVTILFPSAMESKEAVTLFRALNLNQ